MLLPTADFGSWVVAEDLVGRVDRIRLNRVVRRLTPVEQTAMGHEDGTSPVEQTRVVHQDGHLHPIDDI